jgi:Sulfotransferase family
MLLDDFRLAFVHIARTGGTSIEVALAGQDWWLISPQTKHLSARQIRSQCGEEKWNSYLKFSVVRNPWDRVVSMFATGWWMGEDRQCDAQAEFEHFIDNLAPHRNELYSSLMYSEIIDEPLDQIIRYEALQEGFNKVCELIGKPPMMLGREEARARLHYSAYYNEATRRKVAERFKRDIENYSYAFEDTEGFNAAALKVLCRQAVMRRESDDRFLWLGPTLSVPVTRILRRARSARSNLFPQAQSSR